MRKIHRLALAVAGLLVITAAGWAQQPLHWELSIDAAKQIAAGSNRLVLVEFTAPWCGQCRAMEAEVFSQPGVAKAIEANYVPVRINVDYAPQTAKQYGITGLPTTVILAATPRGEVLDSMPGRMEAVAYLTRLNRMALAMRQPPSAPVAHIAGGPPPAAAAAPAVSPPPTAPAPWAWTATVRFNWWRSRPGPAATPAGAPSTKAAPICLLARTSSGGSLPIRTAMPRSTAATTWCWRSRRSKSLPAGVSTACTTSGRVYLFPDEASLAKFTKNPRYYVEQSAAAASGPLTAQQARTRSYALQTLGLGDA